MPTLRLVLHQCALNQDLRLLEAGDATEVGERGLTLRCVSSIYAFQAWLIGRTFYL